MQTQRRECDDDLVEQGARRGRAQQPPEARHPGGCADRFRQRRSRRPVVIDLELRRAGILDGRGARDPEAVERHEHSDAAHRGAVRSAERQDRGDRERRQHVADGPERDPAAHRARRAARIGRDELRLGGRAADAARRTRERQPDREQPCALGRRARGKGGREHKQRRGDDARAREAIRDQRDRRLDSGCDQQRQAEHVERVARVVDGMALLDRRRRDHRDAAPELIVEREDARVAVRPRSAAAADQMRSVNCMAHNPRLGPVRRQAAARALLLSKRRRNPPPAAAAMNGGDGRTSSQVHFWPPSRGRPRVEAKSELVNSVPFHACHACCRRNRAKHIRFDAG